MKPYRFTREQQARLDVLFGERAVWLPLPLDELVAALVEAQERDLDLHSMVVVETVDESALHAITFGHPSVDSSQRDMAEEVTVATSASITVEQLTDAITKQWPSSTLVEKKAYHRVALEKLTLGYAYVRGVRPAVEVIQPDGKYAYIAVKSKADLTRAINAMKTVEKRASKKAAAVATAASKRKAS